jgi:hypothetical protein
MTFDGTRFPAATVLIQEYGDDVFTWAFFGCLAGFLTVFAIGAASASEAPIRSVLPSVALFGAVSAGAGFFLGAVWYGLREEADDVLPGGDVKR